MPSLTPEVATVLIALIAGNLVLGWLRVIGGELDRSVRWHALRVDVQRLRREQQERIAEMEREHARSKERRREEDAVPEAAVEMAEIVETAAESPAEIPAEATALAA